MTNSGFPLQRYILPVAIGAVGILFAWLANEPSGLLVTVAGVSIFGGRRVSQLSTAVFGLAVSAFIVVVGWHSVVEHDTNLRLAVFLAAGLGINGLICLNQTARSSGHDKKGDRPVGESMPEDARRRASDRLAQVTQAASLAELSASIAHEINQPLAAIVANSQACHRWLSAEPPNVERAKITAERITRNAHSAADVINRIRALFRRTPQARSSEDLNRVISEVCLLMADEISAKDIHVETALEPDLPSVALDHVQVLQVFVSLIRNGMEAMDAMVDGARSLQIQSCRDGLDAIRVEIRDAGTGFKDSERVFEPFFTTKPHGTGMGLVICRSIIEAHGGRLWTANNEPCGATVAFTLPLATSEAP
jgi:C4-dicarboxylate-specific signal transduction histidine kinase